MLLQPSPRSRGGGRAAILFVDVRIVGPYPTLRIVVAALENDGVPDRAPLPLDSNIIPPDRTLFRRECVGDNELLVDIPGRQRITGVIDDLAIR